MTKGLPMRCKQFFRAVFSKMNATDHQVVKEILSNKEAELFYGMDGAIQKHSVNVAKTVLSFQHDQLSSTELNLLMRACLLHDIGKTAGSIGVWDRVLYVLLGRFFPNVLCKKTLPLKGLNTIHNHTSTGAHLAMKHNLEENLIFLIREHHNKNLPNQTHVLKLLTLADDMN